MPIFDIDNGLGAPIDKGTGKTTYVGGHGNNASLIGDGYVDDSTHHKTISYNPQKLFTVGSGTVANVYNQEAESIDTIALTNLKESRFIPHVDFGTASNFVKFGSAKKYYEDSYKRIYNFYPYDGSKKEKIEWEVSSSYLDNYIFDYVYPRTNGYVKIGTNSSYTGAPSANFSLLSSSIPEYIYIKGGPNADPNANFKNSIGSGPSSNFLSKANYYNANDNRQSNLKLDPSVGATVEFWMKKSAWISEALERQETLFHLVNLGTTGGVDRGDFRIFCYGTDPDKIFMTFTSGTFSQQYSASSGLTDIADDSWHHYAVTFVHNETNSTAMKLYVDGTCVNTDVVTSILPAEINGALVATIGANVAPSYENGVGSGGDIGWGKVLSSSFDEFRYWKRERSAKQIGRFYIDQINGGTNTDTSNTDLGVYYKFNEGITNTSVDATVLDYSGRISNGAWVGYTSGARSTGSAMIESSATTIEFRDPIIYDFHPDVQSTLADLATKGDFYDNYNTSALINNIPGWIREQDSEEARGLENLIQILATYLDTLYLQIEALPTLKNKDYIREREKPYFFNQKLLSDVGFNVEEILTDNSLFSYAFNRDEQILFQEKLYDVKNQIYKNIYNNLIHINKTKGTEKSFRNLLRCIGIDEEIVRLNTYANGQGQILETSYRKINSKRKYADFYNNLTASVYSYRDASNPNSTGYISASNLADGFDNIAPYTVECEVIFPRYPDETSYEKLFRKNSPPFSELSSSIFGKHGVVDSQTDTSWRTGDTSGFQTYAVRTSALDANAGVRFVLNAPGATASLESPVFEDVYQNSKWNFAVSLAPAGYPFANLVSGTVSSTSASVITYEGYNVLENQILNSFKVSGTINNVSGMFNTSTRLYAGAHRQDFTGSVLKSSDIYVTNVKYWMSKLDSETVKAHAIDDENYGSLHPYQNTFLFETGTLSSVEVPNMASLALNWNFDTVQTSSASGRFNVVDFSYGNSSTSSYGVISRILNKQHTARGEFFKSSASDVVERKNIYAFKQNLPEVINTDDQVRVVDFEGEIFTRESRPIEYFYAFEKSMYRAVSEDMINLFATLKDFHSLIGSPVNRYRYEYKDIEKIRQLFFQRVSNIPDLDKFLEYYKWIDLSITGMLDHLIPATAQFAPMARDIIESHILERNKYQNKFPIVEHKDLTDLESPFTADPGQVEHLHGNPTVSFEKINMHQGAGQGQSSFMAGGNDKTNYFTWQIGSFWKSNPTDPTSTSPTEQRKDPLWWRSRADRTESPISSGDPTIDAQRNQIRDIISGKNTRFAGHGKIRIKKAFTPNDLNSLNLDFTRTALNKDGTQKTITINNTYEEIDIDRTEINKINPKTQLVNLQTVVSATQNENHLAKTIAPFVIYSSSNRGGYSVSLDPFLSGAQIEHNHLDGYGNFKNSPLQGPFAERWVGGMPHRHQPIVQTTEYLNFVDNRSELYNLQIETGSIVLKNRETTQAESKYYRDSIAKRPVVLNNIKTRTGSYNATTNTLELETLGNYTNNYEVIQTVGTNAQRTWLKENSNALTQNTAEILNLIGNYDYNTYPDRDSSQKSVTFNDRFSAVKSPQASALGFLDPASHTFSVYNTINLRNTTVRLGNGLQYTSSSDYEHILFRTITASQPLNSLWRDHMGSYGYNGIITDIPSYHKINGNRKLRLQSSGGTVVTQSVYDNGFIQHAIPQSDRQYRWIYDSLESGSTPFGYITNTSSATFQTIGEVSAGNIYADFVGLNTLIYDPTNIDTNTIGSSIGDYINTSLASIPSMASGGLNALLLHRNGPYGDATWRQIRQHDNPIVRLHRQNNIFSAITRQSTQQFKTRIKGLAPKYKNDLEFKNIRMPVIVDSNNSLKLSLMLNQTNRANQEILLNVPYCNNLQSFASEEALYYFQFGDNNLQNIDQARSDYLTAINLYNQKGIQFNNIKFSQKIYPRNENSFLSGTRTRINYAETLDNTGSNGLGQRDFRTIWRDSSDDRTRATVPGASSLVEAINIFDQQMTNGAVGTQAIWINDPLSVWPLDGVNTADSDNKLKTTNQGLRGSLHKGPIHRHVALTQSDGTCGIPLINIKLAGPRYHGTDDEVALGSTQGSCEINWTANTDRGINPWYDNYEEYASDLKLAGKNSTIIPEFNISKVVPYYYVDNKGDLSVDLPKNFLHLDGANITSSQTEENYNQAFFKEYSFSDFMNHFDVVLNDHKEFSDISEISLSCEGYKKLIPYNGFYPVNRTLQLASLMSQSYGDHITGVSTQPADTCSGRLSWNNYGNAQPALQGLIQPFFAPGILYNTIKSGIAVDWPVYTGSMPVIQQGSGNTSTAFLSSSSNYRIQFESLYDLTLMPTGSRIYTSANGLIQDYFVYSGNRTHNLYELAINNYLAESVNLFLKDGKLTDFVSRPMSEVSFETNQVYRMKIELEMKSGSVMTQGAQINVINLTDNDVSGSRGRPYGPAVRFSTSSLSGDFASFNTCDPAYAPYTPPYFYGKAILNLDYKNTVDDTPTPTLDMIFNALTQSYSNTFDTNIPSFSASGIPFASKINPDSPAIQTMMPLTASLNIFGKRMLEKAMYDSDGKLSSLQDSEFDSSKFEQWVISTKYECPVLEFNSYTGSYSARGMWNNYGHIPTDSQGLTLKILGPSDKEKAEDNVKDLKQIIFGREDVSTQNISKKIGQLADDKKHSISEAIVAIPFLDTVPDKSIRKYLINSPLRDGRKFFKIYKRGMNNPSVVDLSNKMKKYVFPPKFDFVNMENGAVDPFVMFVFEFEHKLKREELQDIWQGIMPECSRKVVKQKSTLTVPTQDNELLADFLKQCASNISNDDVVTNTFDNFKWMVFKVKQRARNNYSGITQDMRDDQRLDKTQREVGQDLAFSYNWPYDYCSLVELSNITTELTIAAESENGVVQQDLETAEPTAPVAGRLSAGTPTINNGNNY